LIIIQKAVMPYKFNLAFPSSNYSFNIFILAKHYIKNTLFSFKAGIHISSKFLSCVCSNAGKTGSRKLPVQLGKIRCYGNTYVLLTVRRLVFPLASF
jgi:hypothetical protein